MKLEHLDYVIQVFQTGSISKAASNLYLSQPYLSSVLKNLEKELKITLFTRNEKGTILTAAGREFMSYATQINELVVKINNLVTLYPADDLDSLISIASIYSFTMMDIFNSFIEINPNTISRINYLEIPNDTIIDAVYTKHATIGFIFYADCLEEKMLKSLESKDMSFYCLVEEPVYVVVSKAHELYNSEFVNIKQLVPYPIIINKTEFDFHKKQFPEWFAANKKMPAFLDNYRSIMYYLTISPNCFTVGQKSLNLTNPFVMSGQLKYIPVADSPYIMKTGCVMRNDTIQTGLLSEYLKHVTNYFVKSKFAK